MDKSSKIRTKTKVTPASTATTVVTNPCTVKNRFRFYVCFMLSIIYYFIHIFCTNFKFHVSAIEFVEMQYHQKEISNL